MTNLGNVNKKPKLSIRSGVVPLFEEEPASDYQYGQSAPLKELSPVQQAASSVLVFYLILNYLVLITF